MYRHVLHPILHFILSLSHTVYRSSDYIEKAITGTTKMKRDKERQERGTVREGNIQQIGGGYSLGGGGRGGIERARQ